MTGNDRKSKKRGIRYAPETHPQAPLAQTAGQPIPADDGKGQGRWRLRGRRRQPPTAPRRGRRVEPNGIRRILRHLHAGLLGHPHPGRGADPPAGGGLPPRRFRVRRAAPPRGAGAPGATTAGAGQPLVHSRRPVARHRNLPEPLGIGLLDAGPRRRRQPRNLAAAPRPGVHRAGQERVHPRLRLPRAQPDAGADARRGGVVPLLQPAGGVRRAVAGGPGAAGGGHGQRRPALQPQLPAQFGPTRLRDARECRHIHRHFRESGNPIRPNPTS